MGSQTWCTPSHGPGRRRCRCRSPASAGRTAGRASWRRWRCGPGCSRRRSRARSRRSTSDCGRCPGRCTRNRTRPPASASRGDLDVAAKAMTADSGSCWRATAIPALAGRTCWPPGSRCRARRVAPKLGQHRHVCCRAAADRERAGRSRRTRRRHRGGPGSGRPRRRGAPRVAADRPRPAVQHQASTPYWASRVAAVMPGGAGAYDDNRDVFSGFVVRRLRHRTAGQSRSALTRDGPSGAARPGRSRRRRWRSRLPRHRRAAGISGFSACLEKNAFHLTAGGSRFADDLDGLRWGGERGAGWGAGEHEVAGGQVWKRVSDCRACSGRYSMSPSTSTFWRTSPLTLIAAAGHRTGRARRHPEAPGPARRA